MPGTTANAGPDVTHALEHAFARLPRPQKVLDPTRPLVPTKASLLKAKSNAKHYELAMPPPAATVGLSASTETAKTVPPIISVTHSHSDSKTLTADILDDTVVADPMFIERQPMQETGPIVTLGTFWQDNVGWSVRAQRGRAALMMVKTVKRNVGEVEQEILKELYHRNIVRLVHSFQESGTIGIAIEYCRVTLAEILHVHLKLEEQQIQCIAHSIFDALNYLSQRGIVHHSVTPRSIRLTTPDLRVVLANFDSATKSDMSSNNTDLIDLGFVILDCMEGHPIASESRNTTSIREQRRNNKVFGLNNAGHWSGSKQLIDFLDELFCEEKTASLKFFKPHRFVSKRGPYECLRPYIELVMLECFTLWVQG